MCYSGGKILGLIPARGGSKGVPRKNIKMLCDKPLVAHTIIEARKSQRIDRLIVSTDDDEISAIATEYKAEVPFKRPSGLADDSARDIDVLLHALGALSKKDGYHPEIIAILRPTSPLKKYFHIDEAITLLLETKEADSVRSITLASQHPLRAWRIINGLLCSFVPPHIFKINEAYNIPRQELPAAYIQNGAIDVVRRKVVVEQKSLLGERILPYELEKKYSINIDTPEDFIEAETMMKKLNNITLNGTRLNLK